MFTANPSITCPGTLNISTVPNNVITAVATYANPTYSDASGLYSFSPPYICTPSSGSVFTIPGSLVSCTVTDAVGLQATCSFQVILWDNVKPTITCPASATVQLTQGYNYTTINFAPTAADNHGVFAVVCSPPSGSVFYLNSVTSVTCFATDYSGNVSPTCSFSYTIKCTNTPTVTCPAYQSIACYNGMNTIVNAYYAPSGFSGCGIKSYSCSPASGTQFQFGNTTVSCTVTDWAGNVSPTCTFKVNVYNNIPPTITCPGNIQTAPSANSVYATVNFSPSGYGTCGLINNAYQCSPPSGSLFPIGTTIVTCNATDTTKLVSPSCSFSVSSIDTTIPTITCPVNQVLLPNASSIYANVTYRPATNAASGMVVSSWCYPAFPAVFQLGTTTTVTCACVDESGLVSPSCTFTIQIVDTIAPVISCVPSITSGPTQGFNYAVVNYSPNATDNSLVRSVTCSPAFGNPFAFGNTNVQCFATDYAGNKSPNCTIVVHVTETTSPNITCPANIVAPPAAGTTSLQVVFTPTAVDFGVVTNVTCSYKSGNYFQLGTTRVTCTATNSVGLVSQPCAFNVSIVSTTPPTIFCPPSATTFVTPGLSTGTYIWLQPNAIGVGAVTVRCNPVFGTTLFPVGNTLINCTATDVSGNQAWCAFTVTVVDNNYPIISCPADLTIPLAYNSASAIPQFTPDSSDGVGLMSTDCSPASGTAFPAGITTTICTATNVANLQTSCVFNVDIVDTQPPNIVCPPTQIVSTSPGLSSGVANWIVPSVFAGTAWDNVAVTLVVCNHTASDNIYPLGYTAILCTSIDTSGNKATCTFQVDVVDTEAPTVYCASSVMETIPSTGSSAFIAWFPPYSTDNVGVVSTMLRKNGIEVADPNSVSSSYPIGATTYSFVSLDAAGNIGQCSWSVVITQAGNLLDFTPPTLVCPTPSKVTVPTEAGVAYAHVTLPAIGFNASVVATWTTIITPPLTIGAGIYPFGLSSVTQVATDHAGNNASCSLTVSVIDNEAPSIVCPLNLDLWCNPPLHTRNLTWTVPHATDNVAVLNVASNLSPGNFKAGFYVVTYTATDTSGNMASCSFNITLQTDTTPPVVSCPVSQITATDLGTSTSVVTWAAPTYTDAFPCTAVYTPAPYSPGYPFPYGITNLAYTVTDTYANTRVCNFRIIVQDKEKPVFLFCPASFNVSLSGQHTQANVTWVAPIVHDNVKVATVNSSIASGSTFDVGVYTVTVNAFDTSGNLANPCVFHVTVVASPDINGATNASAGSSASLLLPAIAAAAGALVLLALLIAVLLRRRTKRVCSTACVVCCMLLTV